MSARQSHSGRPVGRMDAPAVPGRRETPQTRVGFVDLEPAGENWRTDAACTDPRVDPEVFFAAGKSPEDAAETEAAKQVCRLLCPVRWTCAKEAFDHDLRDGVFGGFDADERKSMKRRVARSRSKAAAE